MSNETCNGGANNLSEMQKLIGAAIALRGIDKTPVGVVPENWRIESLERFLPAPTRKSGTVTLSTIDSFGDFINEHKTPETRVFITDSGAFTAVFNYHGKDSAGWGDFRAKMALSQTPEWVAWMAKNGTQFTQSALAEFFEDHAARIVEPSGAEILELVQTLEAKKNVKFDSAQRLTNGKTSIVYDEDIELKGSTGTNKGKIDFPSVLTVGLAPFKSGPTYKVQARLRYRIVDTKITFWYQLIEPEKVIEAVIEAMVLSLHEQTDVDMFRGCLA